jgi:hypothetical protein
VHDAALADEPPRAHRAQERHVQVDRGLELVGAERREERGADGVVEHRGLEGAQHIPRRVGEVLRRRERQLDRAALDARVDELQPEGPGGARHRRPPLDGIPERT